MKPLESIVFSRASLIRATSLGCTSKKFFQPEIYIQTHMINELKKKEAILKN